MFWDEDRCLVIAPGQNNQPLSLLLDPYAEEYSFPSVYLGVDRKIKKGVRATPYTHCTSEIRRFDRRAVKPQYILYKTMYMMRMKVRDGIQNMFRCLRGSEKITREMIEDVNYVKKLVETNQAFFKTIPNSMQFWASRKKNVFAMMRRSGRPTAFMTLSANEVNWPDLISALHKWSPIIKNEDLGEHDIFERLSKFERVQLVAEDPILCCVHFYRMLLKMMSILKSKRTSNPSGQHYVVDYFVRIEFQQRAVRMLIFFCGSIMIRKIRLLGLSISYRSCAASIWKI